MALQKAMVSSESSEWGTPQLFFDFLNDEFHFTLDPCATKANAKCKKFFTKKDNGLTKSWAGEVVFVNPPYARYVTEQWVEKCYQESLKGARVVMLLSAGTGRNYWHRLIFEYAAQIRWVRGFFKFEGAASTAPFGSAIVIFDTTKKYTPRFVHNYPRREIMRSGKGK